jgi:hypothetical protein
MLLSRCVKTAADRSDAIFSTLTTDCGFEKRDDVRSRNVSRRISNSRGGESCRFAKTSYFLLIWFVLHVLLIRLPFFSKAVYGGQLLLL